MTILAPTDPPACSVIEGLADSPVIFVSDHDSKAVPASLGDLGLSEEERGRHIAYDIGIAPIARRLAARFSAPLIVTGYSRLICDCNRRPGAASSMPEVADGTVVPANQNLSDADRQARLDALFTPYHAAIIRQLDAMRPDVLFVALHSFTPALRVDPGPRPWEIGMLWGSDDRASRHFLEILGGMRPDLTLGANQPYAGYAPDGYTVPVHAEGRGLPNLTVEFRQDLVSEESDALAWADVFGDALAEMLRVGVRG